MKFPITKSIILGIILVFGSVNNQLFDFMQKGEKTNSSKSSSLFQQLETTKKVDSTKSDVLPVIKPQNENKTPTESIPPIDPEKHYVFNYQENDKQKQALHYEFNNQHDKDKKAETNVNTIPSPSQASPINAPQVEKEGDRITKIIENNRHELNELDKHANKRTKVQQQELQDLEDKYKEISMKTKQLQKLLHENKSLKELKETKKTLKNSEANWDTYILKLKEINNEISNLSDQIDVLQKTLKAHLSSHHFKKIISARPLENVDVQNSLNIKGNLHVENLISSELKLGNNLKITENLIEIPDDYLLIYNGREFAFKDLVYYNTMANKLRQSCGENLNCFIKLEEDIERKKKEEIMEKTIETIKIHLQILKN